MILTYGSYSHDQNECSVTITKRAEHNDRGYRTRIIENWLVRGVKQAASQADLTTALAAMQLAYASDYQNVGLYLDDGTTLTTHYLTNSSTLSGVKVKRIDFPAGDGAEYSTFRTYEIELEADFGVSGANALLVSFQETLQFIGGGPRFVFLQTITGQPQKQLVAQSTPYRAIQSGSAVQMGGYPRVPGPIWPDAERIDERQISLRGPSLGRGFTGEFGVDWSYVFESATGLSGQPTLR